MAARTCLAAVVSAIALISTFAPRFADAQTSIYDSQRIGQPAPQPNFAPGQLTPTQAQFQDVHQRTAAGPPIEASDIRRLPPVDDRHRLASRSRGGIELNGEAASCNVGHDSCADCGKAVCPGLPHLCTHCREKLSWNKGGSRIVPYGAVCGEMIASDNTIWLRGSPLYLVPGPAPGIQDSRFTVSGQQSTIGLNITGRDFGPFQSGANVAVNFFGEQPVQNNPGLFFLRAFAELKNEHWRFWVGQAPDAIGRQETNSPAWSSHKMSGNFGQLRPGVRVERFFHHSEIFGSSVYFGLTQQAVNDFIVEDLPSGS